MEDRPQTYKWKCPACKKWTKDPMWAMCRSCKAATKKKRKNGSPSN